MQIRIFDVEHGGCALVTADSGARILIDCGHNSTTGWRPSTYLRQLGVGHLEKLIITNYDEDHASDLANLVKTVSIGVLVSNPSVTDAQLRQLKKIGGIGSGIDALADMKSRYTASVIGDGANFGNLSTTFFWNRYPTEFEDENNLSLVVIMKAHGLTICFPGDMEVQGWENLLRNLAFVQAMGEVNVFVASHHGRANGCSGQLFSQTGLNPAIVVISDSGIEYATQETVAWYRIGRRASCLMEKIGMCSLLGATDEFWLKHCRTRRQYMLASKKAERAAHGDGLAGHYRPASPGGPPR